MQLSEAQKGLHVRYTHGAPGSPYEDGVISSWNDTFIFVVFGTTFFPVGAATSTSTLTAKACYPFSLRMREE